MVETEVKIVETEVKLNTSFIHIHDISLSWLGTDTKKWWG
jgi:hypothetical protein